MMAGGRPDDSKLNPGAAVDNLPIKHRREEADGKHPKRNRDDVDGGAIVSTELARVNL
jgi:hypothetical protein